ncbi:MAG: 4Fe-4S binding protein [Candidatus Bathyarchaeota archaeon]|nr:MAG: 4Fe-4S binding protein [Candidatus Bathyarchaeota archaeon]
MSENKSLVEKMMKPWPKMPLACTMLQPGSAIEHKTGDWRIRTQPVLDSEKCIMCLFCWIFCPDASIIRDNASVTIDYEHCKGCGICSTECPVKAIEMVEV